MIYSLSIEISIEEFKILREAVTLYRSEVFSREVQSEGIKSPYYELVDRIYHHLQSFKDRA